MGPDSLSPSFSRSQILPSRNKSFPAPSKAAVLLSSGSPPPLPMLSTRGPRGLLYACLRLCPLGGRFSHSYLYRPELSLPARRGRPARGNQRFAACQGRDGGPGGCGVGPDFGPHSPKVSGPEGNLARRCAAGQGGDNGTS